MINGFPDPRKGAWRVEEIEVIRKGSKGPSSRFQTFTEKDIIAICRKTPSVEVVGAVIRSGNLRNLSIFQNVHHHPDRAFRLTDRDSKSLFLAERDDPGCVEVLWHSHPGGSLVPSQMDKDSHPDFIPVMMLISPKDGKIARFRRHG